MADENKTAEPASQEPAEPKQVLDQQTVVDLVQVVREHVKAKWSDDQLLNAGVLIVQVDNSGFVSISGSPGLRFVPTLKLALMHEMMGNFEGYAVGNEGVEDISDEDLEKSLAGDAQAYVEARQKVRKEGN